MQILKLDLNIMLINLSFSNLNSKKVCISLRMHFFRCEVHTNLTHQTFSAPTSPIQDFEIQSTQYFQLTSTILR